MKNLPISFYTESRQKGRLSQNHVLHYMHNFWDMTAGLEQQHEMQNFVKNIGIFAGLLILSATHPGKYSLR